MPRFKPHSSIFNSLQKTSGSNTHAQSPSSSDPFQRCSYEAKTSSAPHPSSDEVLPPRRGIGHDFDGGLLRHCLSRNRPALSDLSPCSVSCSSIPRSTAPRPSYPRLAGLPAVAQPTTGHHHTCQPCHLSAPYAGRTRLDPAAP